MASGSKDPPVARVVAGGVAFPTLPQLGGVSYVFGDFGSTAGPLVALPVATHVGYVGEYAASAGLEAPAAGLVG